MSLDLQILNTQPTSLRHPLELEAGLAFILDCIVWSFNNDIRVKLFYDLRDKYKPCLPVMSCIRELALFRLETHFIINYKNFLLSYILVLSSNVINVFKKKKLSLLELAVFCETGLCSLLLG